MPLAMERRERLIQNGTAAHAKIVANMMIAETPKTKETPPKPYRCSGMKATEWI